MTMRDQSPAPRRKVETEWGSVYAVGVTGETVHFRTSDPSDRDHDFSLVINRVAYKADIRLTCEKTTEEDYTTRARSVDDTWRVAGRYSWGDITRLSGGDPTSGAVTVFRHQILPSLARWLSSADGQQLLREGADHRLAGLLADIRTAKTALLKLAGRVARAELTVAPSGTITQEDLRLVEEVNRQATMTPWRQTLQQPDQVIRLEEGETRPFIRYVGQGSLPEGWVAEPAGRWMNKPVEIAFNPLRYEWTRFNKPFGEESLKVLMEDGWEVAANDHHSQLYVLIRDRVDHAQMVLARSVATEPTEMSARAQASPPSQHPAPEGGLGL